MSGPRAPNFVPHIASPPHSHRATTTRDSRGLQAPPRVYSATSSVLMRPDRKVSRTPSQHARAPLPDPRWPPSVPQRPPRGSRSAVRSRGRSRYAQKSRRQQATHATVSLPGGARRQAGPQRPHAPRARVAPTQMPAPPDWPVSDQGAALRACAEAAPRHTRLAAPSGGSAAPRQLLLHAAPGGDGSGAERVDGLTAGQVLRRAPH